MHLLDVNVLIALVDETHTHHALVLNWFLGARRDGWATCPLVENGFIRIVGHPNYPGGPGSTGPARDVLANLCQSPGHQFWPDSCSLLDGPAHGALPASKDLTDHYLLLLAIQNQSKLATLDRRMNVGSIKGGEGALVVIR